MKFGLLSITSWLSLMAAPVAPMQLAAQTQKAHYTIIDLGPSSTPFSQAGSINNIGLVSGVAAVPNGAQHAELWFKEISFRHWYTGVGRTQQRSSRPQRMGRGCWPG